MYRTVVALALAKTAFGFQMTWHPKAEAAASDGDDEPRWKAKHGGGKRGGREPELKEVDDDDVESGGKRGGKAGGKAGGKGDDEENDYSMQKEDVWGRRGKAKEVAKEATRNPDQAHDICFGPCCQSGTGQHKIQAKPDVAIKLIMTDGCSGSTAVMEIAEQLHAAANLSFANCRKRREVFDDIAHSLYDIGQIKGDPGTEKNTFIGNRGTVQNGTVSEIFEALVNHTSGFGLPLLVKEQSDYLLKDADLRKLVKQEGKVGIFLRSNLFDLALCDIKDGIGAGQGMGKCPSCHAFRDRGGAEKDDDDKVTFDAHNLLLGLQTMTNQQKQRVKFYTENFAPTWGSSEATGSALSQTKLQTQAGDLDASVLDDEDFLVESNGATMRVITAEDLFAFEYSKTGLSKSIRAWIQLVKQIGSKIPDTIIVNFLKSRAASRPPQKPHSETIKNIDEVKQVIKNCHKKHAVKWCDSLYGMLRFGPEDDESVSASTKHK